MISLRPLESVRDARESPRGKGGLNDTLIWFRLRQLGWWSKRHVMLIAVTFIALVNCSTPHFSATRLFMTSNLPSPVSSVSASIDGNKPVDRHPKEAMRSARKIGFASALKNARQSGARPNLAAEGGKKMAGSDGNHRSANTSNDLQKSSLGPRVRIISPSGPPPSDKSLLDFARSQGVDENVIAMIMAKEDSESISNAAETIENGLVTDLVDPAALLADPSALLADPSALLTDPTSLYVNPTDPSVAAVTGGFFQWQELGKEHRSDNMAAAASAAAAAAASASAAAAVSASAAAAGAAGPLIHGNINGATAAGSAKAAAQVAKPAEGAGQALGQALNFNGSIPPEIVGGKSGFAPTATEMLAALTRSRAAPLMRSKPLPEEVSLTRSVAGQAVENETSLINLAQLGKGPVSVHIAASASLLNAATPETSLGDLSNQTKLSDAVETAASVTVISGKPGIAPALSELDFSPLVTGNLSTEAPPAPGQDLGNGLFRSLSADGVVTQKLDLSSSAPSSPQDLQDAAFRSSEHYQLLSDRVSAAIGQRVLAEVSLGNWKLDLQLNPAHLGKVDVRLGRRAGGPIEAEFSASEARTMELLVAGLPKLKEIMSSSGLDLNTLNLRHEGSSPKENGASGKQGFAPPVTQANSLQNQADDLADASTSGRANYIRADGLDVTI